MRPMAEGAARNLLARFLFTGDDVYKRVGDLSGGERSRVALAKLTLIDANFLLLDEPTNHLDLDAREALEDVLGEYNGTLLFVSHDRAFIDNLATQIWVLERLRASTPSTATTAITRRSWRAAAARRWAREPPSQSRRRRGARARRRPPPARARASRLTPRRSRARAAHPRGGRAGGARARRPPPRANCKKWKRLIGALEGAPQPARRRIASRQRRPGHGPA